MSTSRTTQTVLGLDIGVASVGWCLLEYRNEVPSRILGTGSRIFSPGVDGDFKNGRDEPKNQKRRQARQMRRQLWRRRRRLLKLLRALVRLGLLPDPGAFDPASIDRMLKELDARLGAQDPLMGDRRGAQVFHYRLRARAAQTVVPAHELGRALYHLAQHRGFLSNRLAKKKDGEEDGVVAEGIHELQAKMNASGLLTLGAYFASIDPEVERIRARWLGRNEFIIPEFKAIQRAQSRHQSSLSEADWQLIEDAIFRQRPLRDQSHLIGRCSIEPAEIRCPVAYPAAQRFRVLQNVNHLRVMEMDGEIERVNRALTSTERDALIKALELESHLTWTQAKKLLGFKPKGVKFSIELGGEKDLIGNRTAATMRVAIGACWDDMSEEDQARLIDDVLEYESQEALETRCVRRWGLSKDDAKNVAAIKLEAARLNLSARAIRNLLPHLEAGLFVAEAKVLAYPSQSGVDAPWEFLPPIKPDRVWQEHSSGGRPYRGIEIRNPAVERSLSELRKIINAVIRRWGKPDQVRIELARDLKKPRKERVDETKRMREQEGRRDSALDRMVKEGFSHIADSNKRSDVEKVLLWEECGGVCPYTGKSINFEDLFGQSPRFEVEHIIPYALCLEDGFGNKTLCEVNENRNRKRRNSPYGAYHGTPQWDSIISRAKLFRSPSARKKLRLFESVANGSEIFGDFLKRQLNDTRYASRLAMDYVGLLFGGGIDLTKRQRVFVSAGGATAIVRRKLGIEGVLGGGGKNRSDHRHHAIDAIAIALTGPAEVKAIADASEAAVVRGEASHRLKLDVPWPNFIDDVKRSIAGIVVSHRADCRLSGPLHQEKNYSRPIRDARGDVRRGVGKTSALRHRRYLLVELGEGDVKYIVDPRVREAVQQKLAELKQPNPKVAFKDKVNLPSMRHGDGRDVLIQKARIQVNVTLDEVGRGGAARHVVPGSNHHMEVIETLDAEGKVIGCELEVVTLLEAFRRKQRGAPIVQTDWGTGRRLAFTLRSGDSVSLKDREGVRCIALVTAVSDGDLHLKRVSDARPRGEARAESKAGRDTGLLRVSSAKAFFAAGVEKLVVHALGDVRRSND